MNTLSVCMIVKNEEVCLRECLEQVSHFADEIIVVDTGSRDTTKEIARQFTDAVYDYEWNNDFGAARNFAFSLGTGDYLMSLDADERFTEENLGKMIAYKPNITGDAILFSCERPEYQTRALQVRMVRRTQGPYWHGKIHEFLPAEGTVVDSRITFLHQKKGLPDYRRNVPIIDSLPKETLQNDFWLCAQCWMDLVLAGEDRKAEILFEYLKDNQQPYDEKKDTIFLLTQALQTRHHRQEAVRLFRLALLELKKQNRERKERR